MVQLPDTSAFMPTQLVRHDDEVPVPPAAQQLPSQEPGVRPARALPYALDASAAVQLGDGSVRLAFSNTGTAAAVFHVRSTNAAHAPRSYTVEAGKTLSGVWPVAGIGATEYDLSVYGPNGFLRAFKGSIVSSSPRIEVAATYETKTTRITLTMTNSGSHAVTIDVLDNYSGKATSAGVTAGASVSKRWSLSRFDGWYDFLLTAEFDGVFAAQLAGHLETGDDSITDPAMGGVV
jgi:phospholipase C